jgi:fructose-bisphosphate aldolase class I
MEDTIKKLLAPAKGILANDESTKTLTKRMEAIGVTSTPEINRKYRQMIVTTPGLENYISGIIFYDETVRQNLDDGSSFIDYITKKGIVPGIKVDGGLASFGGTEQEVTKGLETLSQRLDAYSKMGLRFTKWRGVFLISDIFPTDSFLEENINRMVNFIKISQEHDMVPVPEPEVLLDGNHTTTRCEEITTKVLKLLFEKLKVENIPLANMILKTNMVLPGKDSGAKAAPLEVAQATLRTLKNSVSTEIPGVVFLSGGQSPDEATDNLNQIEKLKGEVPWQISFSYLRALQDEARAMWAGKDENTAKAQETFLERAKKVSLARQGLIQ